jgi:hypothetical protein
LETTGSLDIAKTIGIIWHIRVVILPASLFSFEFSIGTKRLETLKQAALRVTRLALVFNLARSFAVVPTQHRHANTLHLPGLLRVPHHRPCSR